MSKLSLKSNMQKDDVHHDMTEKELEKYIYDNEFMH